MTPDSKTHVTRMLRPLAKSVLPRSVFERLVAERSRRRQLGFLRRHGLLASVQTYLAEHGATVKAGPFAGLRYSEDVALVRWCLPKLLGTYELELHPFLKEISTRHYDCVIDVGSAEGYYACGLARMLRVPVYAYEPERKEKAFCTAMAALNGVENLVFMEDLFTVQTMSKFASMRALVVCDCEGFEETLLQKETVGLTKNWDVIIELHKNANHSLPALPWTQKTTLIDIEHRNGLEDEWRSEPQQFLLCDAQAVPAGTPS